MTAALNTSEVSSEIIVLGAGAMGCYFAARMAESGAQVTLVDVDQSRIAHLNAHGLRVIDDHGTRIVRIAAARSCDLTRPASLILVFTKGMHTRAAVEQAAHLVGPATAILTLQNGLGNPEAIAAILPDQPIFFGVTDVPADLHPPAEVHSHGQGKITLWSLNEDTATLSDAADLGDALAAMLVHAGFAATADVGAAVAVWEKIAFNAALNAPCAILDCPVGGLDQPAARTIVARVVDETIAVAQARGIAVDRDRIVSRIDHALAEHRSHQPSMLQDIRAGRQTEIALINGAIVDAGAAAGIAAPTNATLADLVKAREAMARGAPREPDKGEPAK